MAVDRINGISGGNSYGGRGGAGNSDNFTRAISNKIDELREKILNGETEEKFQIGNASYTLKEWDKILERFDSQEEAVRKMMREEQQERMEDAKQEKEIVANMQKKLREKYNLS
ncbi:MAG: hypothetical protein ACI4AQ_03010 [Lachnospiraceae bacterium]